MTLGIGLAVVGAVTTFGVLTGSWKKSFSRRLIKEFNKDNAVISKGCEAIDTYWSDTSKAFLTGSDALLQESIDYINKEYERSNLEAEKKLLLKNSLKDLYGQLAKFYSAQK